MARKAYRDDDEEAWDEGIDDPDAPPEADQDVDDDPETVPCAFCRRAILEDAEICPYCGNFVAAGDAPYSKPTWIVVTVVVLLATMLFGWVIFRAF